MLRFNICSTCVKVTQTHLNHTGTGKHNKNKVKKYEKDNPCKDSKPTNKRYKSRKLRFFTPPDMVAKYRGKIPPTPYLSDMHIDPEARADLPNDLTETSFSDDATYDAYVAIFMKCSDAAKSTSSDDVLEESLTPLYQNERIDAAKPTV